jgi:hypothetical protein
MKSSFRKTNNKKGRRVKVMRQTHTRNTGIPKTSVTISMKDSDDSMPGMEVMMTILGLVKIKNQQRKRLQREKEQKQCDCSPYSQTRGRYSET